MSDLPTPINRNEQYLNAIANGDPSDLPTPITREEQYLDYIAKNGGGSGGAGVSSFNGRTGAVVPKAGDYTAEQVGALPANTPIPSVDEVPTENSTNAVQSGGVYSAEKALSDTMAANGAHNLLPNNASTTEIDGVTFTVNSDGSVTMNGTPTQNFPLIVIESNLLLKAGSYILSSGQNAYSIGYVHLTDKDNTYVIADTYDKQNGETPFVLTADTYVRATVVVYMRKVASNVTVYPMIRLATDPSTEYTPYSMTNRELTERVIDLDNNTPQIASGVTLVNLPQSFSYGYYYFLFPSGAFKLGKTVTITTAYFLGDNDNTEMKSYISIESYDPSDAGQVYKILANETVTSLKDNPLLIVYTVG